MEEHRVSSTISTCCLSHDFIHYLQVPVSSQLSAHCALPAHWVRLLQCTLPQEVRQHRFLQLYLSLTCARTVPLGSSSHIFTDPNARILHDRLDLCGRPDSIDRLGCLCRWSSGTSSRHCQRFRIHTTTVARPFVLLGYSFLRLCAQRLGSQSPTVTQYRVRSVSVG